MSAVLLALLQWSLLSTGRSPGEAQWISCHRHTDASLCRTVSILIPTCFLVHSQSWSQVHELGGFDLISRGGHFIPSRGEGWVRAMTHLRAEGIDHSIADHRDSAKRHGFGPASWGAFKGLHPRLKRSFRRAKTRAVRNGYCWYRGKLLDRTQLSCSPVPEPPVTPVRTRPPRPSQPNLRTRIHALAWNSTGLASWKLDELRCWLADQPFQVVLLTETRWQYDREWIEGGWIHIACSGDPYRSCGMLFMIRTTLRHQSQTSWKSVIPGRLVMFAFILLGPLI